MITYIMSRHMDFTGQRADKIKVAGVEATENGVVKDVVRYTVSCTECGADGYYDQRGDVVCDGCGMLLGGAPVIPTEHGPNPGDDGHGSDNSDMGGLTRGVGVVDDEPFYEPEHRNPYDKHRN